jgi:hypothetical protein
MPSHIQGCGFNMESCMACEEKSLSHNLTDAEKRCEYKTQPDSQADL